MAAIDLPWILAEVLESNSVNEASQQSRLLTLVMRNAY
jgi:hypothetical protein